MEKPDEHHSHNNDHGDCNENHHEDKKEEADIKHTESSIHQNCKKTDHE